MQKKEDATKIPVIVVESHHHVLEHIHLILRRQKQLLSSWSLLHWDAHPDLACPRIPAQQCFRPHDATHISLYDALDATPSGIAEWILPLVFAAQLHHIQWIRPIETSMQQLPDGDFVVSVGAWGPKQHKQVDSFLDLPLDAVLKVNWSVPYYQDDDDDVQDELLLPQEMQLKVATEPSHDRLGSPFALDVCLDYFYCHNPFVDDDRLASILHRSIPCQNYARPTSHDMKRMKQFQSCWTELINNNTSDTNQWKELAEFFEGKQHVEELQALMTQYRMDGQQLPTDIANILTMPHDGPNNCISERLQHFTKNLPKERPFFISIARSSLEGFTPVNETEHLQESVLKIVHEKYCGCGFAMDAMQCKFQLVRDYGEWEGSNTF